jgi:hypothetical protein
MHERFFIIKKFKKYFDGFLKYFITFVKEKSQKNITSYTKILVQITVKKLVMCWAWLGLKAWALAWLYLAWA